MSAMILRSDLAELHGQNKAPMPADGSVERMVMGWMKLS